MTDHGRLAGIDLRSAVVCVAVSAADGGVRTTSVPAAVAMVDGRLVYGQAAADALVSHPEAGWSDLLDRVGDPVPIRLGSEALPASDLVARVIAGCIAGPVTELRIVAPEGWSAGRRRRLSASLTAAGLPTPRWIDVIEVLAPAPDASAGDGRVLLLTMGARATVARVLCPATKGWRTDAVHQADFGSDDIKETTFTLAAARVSEAAGRPLTSIETRILGGICAPAADRLPDARRLDLNLPGLPGARVSRPDVEEALAPRLAAAFGGLAPALASQGVTTLPQRVLLEGPGTRLPLISATISGCLGRPVNPIVADTAAALTTPAFADVGGVEVEVETPRQSADTTPATAPAPMSYGWVDSPAPDPRGRPWVRTAVAVVVLLGLLAGAGYAARDTIQGVVAGFTGRGSETSIPATVVTTPGSISPAAQTMPTATTIPPVTPSAVPTPMTPSGSATSSTSTKAATSTATKSTTSTTKKATATTTSTTTTTTTTAPASSSTTTTTTTTAPASSSTTTTTTTSTTPPPSSSTTTPAPTSSPS